MYFHAGAVRTEESERGLLKASEAPGVSAAMVAALGSATEPKKGEDRQSIYLERDESLDKALR